MDAITRRFQDSFNFHSEISDPTDGERDPMGFRKQSQVLVTTLTRWAILSSVSLSLLTPATVHATSYGGGGAGNSCNEEYNDGLQKVKDEEKVLKAAIADAKRFQGELVSGIDLPDSPELNGSCNCLAQKAVNCTESDWAKVGLESKEDGTGGCRTLYDRIKSGGVVVASACRATVMGDGVTQGCSVIRREVERARMPAKIAELQKRLSDGLAEKKEELKQEKRNCLKDPNCPDCGLQGSSAMMRMSTPGWKEIAAASIPSVASAILGGVGMYYGNKQFNASLNSYTGNYQALLEQCMTVGVPCPPPMMMGPGMGGMMMGGGGMIGGVMMAGMMPGMMMGGMGGMMPGMVAGVQAGIMTGMMPGGMMMGGMMMPVMMPNYGMMPGMVAGVNAGVMAGMMPGMMMGGMMPGMIAGVQAGVMTGMMPGMMMQGGGFPGCGGAMPTIGGCGIGGMQFPGAMQMTAGYAMPYYPVGTGFSPSFFPGGPYSMAGGGQFPGCGGGMGPCMPGMMMQGGGVMGYNTGINGMALGMNPQYQMLMQSSWQQQMLSGQSSAQAQQDLMISQQQLYQAQLRAYQSMGGGVFGGMMGGVIGGGMMNGAMMVGGVGGGIQTF
jgi:hypothetical protein